MDILTTIFIAALVVFILVLLATSKKGQFDERQELIRGRGFKYGFWAICLVDALLLLVVRKFVLSPQLLLLLSLFAGLWVFSLYALWDSAYFAMNQKKIKQLSWLFLFLGVLYTVQSITDPELRHISLRSWNGSIGILIMAVYFLTVGGLMVYCVYRDQHKQD
ncbi:hypothetical protein [uncultured Limosilactobacillus sp.]|uniref:hypothetical protein n=1 Tax=uncultured Limosilactobacillus sp. TaxID=2837629 RepID=UPI0025E0D2FA|nr:hypothetical protein [uncultured Limosilactobacillus sp.]